MYTSSHQSKNFDGKAGGARNEITRRKDMP